MCVCVCVCVFVRENEMDQTEYTWERVNGRKIYIWCSLLHIFISYFILPNVFRRQNLSAYKSILLKNIENRKITIEKLFHANFDDDSGLG